MTSEPVGEEDREPSGSEAVLVDTLRQARAAKTASDCFYEMLMKLGYAPKGLTNHVELYREKLKAEARAL